VQDFKDNIILPPTLCRVSTHKSEKQRLMLQIVDVWIPFFPISPNHFNRIFQSKNGGFILNWRSDIEGGKL
jgi:hypothetical protein